MERHAALQRCKRHAAPVRERLCVEHLGGTGGVAGTHALGHSRGTLRESAPSRDWEWGCNSPSRAMAGSRDGHAATQLLESDDAEDTNCGCWFEARVHLRSARRHACPGIALRERHDELASDAASLNNPTFTRITTAATFCSAMQTGVGESCEMPAHRAISATASTSARASVSINPTKTLRSRVPGVYVRYRACTRGMTTRVPATRTAGCGRRRIRPPRRPRDTHKSDPAPSRCSSTPGEAILPHTSHESGRA